jgi:cytochrome c oxidase subunit IV
MAQSEGHQQHPLGIYFWVWGLLFVLSGFSYGVDYFQLEGMLRWSLILLFMFLKAGTTRVDLCHPGATFVPHGLYWPDGR